MGELESARFRQVPSLENFDVRRVLVFVDRKNGRTGKTRQTIWGSRDSDLVVVDAEAAKNSGKAA